MAVVTTQIVAPLTPFPYSGERAPGSAIPGRELRAYANETVATPGAGNNQHFYCTVSLPRNYGYCLTDIGVSVRSAAGAANNWGGSMVGFYQNSASAPTFAFPLPLYARNAAIDDGNVYTYREYVPEKLPSMILIPALPTDQVTINVGLYNATANDGAYQVIIAARLLEFDLSTAYRWEVNSPVPVRP